MTVAQFWTIASSEVRIEGGKGGKGKGLGHGRDKRSGKPGDEDGRGGGWTGRGGQGGPGKGSAGPLSGPVSQLFTIAADHGSRNFNVTQINGVDIAAFSFVQVAARGLTSTGGTDARYFGVRLSADGGSTWISGNGDYRSIWYQATVTSGGDQNHFRCLLSTDDGDFSCLLKNLNAVMPTSMLGHELGYNVVDIKRWSGMTLLSAVAHNALQFTIEQASSPVFTGGTLDLTGYP